MRAWRPELSRLLGRPTVNRSVAQTILRSQVRNHNPEPDED